VWLTHVASKKNNVSVILIVLLCILISSKLFLPTNALFIKHKMLQLTLKISLYMAPRCFGPFGPSSGSIRWNLAKVTVFVEIISKNAAEHLVHTLQTEAHIATAQQQF
jgi:hypothetical protein